MTIPPVQPGIHAHVGMVCRDLDEAVAHLGPLLGLTFTAPFDGADAPPFATGGGAPAPGLVRTCTSTGGPMRVELLEGRPASVWHTTELLRLHHVAYWVDDVAAAADAMVATGWTVEITRATDHGRPDGFAYLTRPGHARVELTDGRDLARTLAPLGWAAYADVMR